MGFKGLFFFSTKKEIQGSSKFLFSSPYGYIIHDHQWFRKNLDLAPSFFVTKENSITSNLSEFFASTSEKYSSLVEIKSSDFFFNTLQSQRNDLTWGIHFDEAKHILSLARDPFGNYPFYYIHRPYHFVAFATDIPSLFSLLQAESSLFDLHTGRIVNYLSGILNTKATPYNSQTIYENVKTVLPGYIASFTESGVSQKLYNIYNPEKWSILNNISEYGDAVQFLLKKSVYKHTKTKNIIGAHLSGGLDSSSICALVKSCFPDKELHTYFNNVETQYTNENQYADEVASHINSIHHLVSPTFDELNSVILNTTIYGQPDQMMAAPSMQWDVFRNLKSHNCQQLLTGLDGDGIIGYGQNYIFELYKNKDWETIKTLLDKSSEYNYILGREEIDTSNKRKKKYFNYLFKYFAQAIKQNSFTDSVNVLEIAYTKFGISPLDFIKRCGRALFQKIKSSQPNNLLNDNFFKNSLSATPVDVITSLPHNTSINQQNHYGQILFDSNIRVSEELFEIGKYLGFPINHPFYDTDLYELSLAVPQSIKYSNGMFRGHLRQAMINILPENVRTRIDKAAFDIFYKQSSLNLYQQAQDYLTPQSPIWEYINIQKFNTAIETLKSNKISGIFPITLLVNQAIFFSIFLDLHKKNQLTKNNY